jgi:hypothetical protein
MEMEEGKGKWTTKKIKMIAKEDRQQGSSFLCHRIKLLYFFSLSCILIIRLWIDQACMHACLFIHLDLAIVISLWVK